MIKNVSLQFNLILLPLFFVLLLSSCSGNTDQKNARPNVLLITIDDQNNDLGALGADHIQSPNLDRFSESARLFSRHFVQVPSCGPSRAALYRGMRPTDAPYLPNDAMLNTHEEWAHQSLPRVFRDHGYRTLALGKITHYPGGLTGEGWAEEPEELPGVWDRAWVPEDAPWVTPLDMMHGFANGKPRDRGRTFDAGTPAWEAYDGPDKSYPDGWVAEDAIKTLEELAQSEDPWFFGVGFFKPHLPFSAPKKYYDLYDPHDIPVPEDTVRQPAPSSWHPSNELLINYGQHPGHPQTDEAYARHLRLAYAASTSFVDAQVGKVMEAVDRLDLDDNTIVVIWGDHGFALGHRGIWAKHAVYEAALKSPLMIRYPGMERPGEISDAIVETIDIFPTLMELAGLPAPGNLHGNSLIPQLENPGEPSSKPAFAFGRNGQTTVRVDDWRLIMHRDGEDVLGYELFDFEDHPEGTRRDPGDYPEVTSELSEHFNALPWISR